MPTTKSNPLSTAKSRLKGAKLTPLIIAIDIGTGGARGCAFDARTGELIEGPCTEEFQTRTEGTSVLLAPDAGCIATQEVIRKLRLNQTVAKGRVRAFAIGGHMHAPFLIEAYDWAAHREAHMWNSGSTRDLGPEVRRQLGFNVPDRTSVMHLLRELRQEPSFVENLGGITTQSGYVASRLTGAYGLDPCEFSGLGVLDPLSGQVSTAIDNLFPQGLLDKILPKRIELNSILGTVTKDAAGYLGVPYEWIRDAVVAPPGGDQGDKRIGMGARKHHASLGWGTSVVLITETDSRPQGNEFDPFRTPFGTCLNMGLYQNGLRTGDGMVRQFLPEFGENKGRLFQTLGQEAAAAFASYSGEFGVDFQSADLGLGVQKAHSVQLRQDANRGLKWLMHLLQQAASVDRRLNSLGTRPTSLITGGEAVRDPVLMQLVADYTGCTLIVPEGAELADNRGAMAKGRLAEEIHKGNKNVNPREFLEAEIPEPAGRTFYPRNESADRLSMHRQQFEIAIRATA